LSAQDAVVEAWDHAELARLLQIVVLCSETEVETQAGGYSLRGSSTENALVHMALCANLDVGHLRQQYPQVYLNPRAEDRNYMTTLHTTPEGKTLLACKGSPDEVLAMCTTFAKEGESLPLSEEARLNIDIENEQMAGRALRVLGVAYRELDDGFDASDEGASGETAFIWLGLVGMADPLRPGVKDLIEVLHEAGIDTLMITGDQSATAYAIARELHLQRDGQLESLESAQLTAMDPQVVGTAAQRVQVFARVSPAHKLQIVQALQQAGKVVAVTGDGINDSPALKAADIGIAMGQAGADVAREVADVVLEDDDLETLVLAISHGRAVYANIRKAVHFLLATNLSEIMVMFTALAAGLGHPLSAMQLLWINLVSDVFPALALGLEAPEPQGMQCPPRPPEEPILQPADLKRIGFEAMTLSAGALGAYSYGLWRYGMGPRANTLAFTSLTTGQLVHAFSCRSETHGLFNPAGMPPNPYLTAAVGGSLALQGLTLIVPGFRNVLGITPISVLDSVIIGGSALLPLLVNEATKPQAQEPAE
jgi:P-type Ca2+ transporter type 2C